MSMKLSITVIFLTLCLIIQSEFLSCEAREIAPEDVLGINVYGHDDLSLTTRVSSDGEISYPLLGTLKVAGKKVRELEKDIQALLDMDYIVNPHVVVFTKEYQLNIVSVMGEVKKPTTIDLNKNKVTSILEAISMAEGFSDTANKNKIQIIRTAPDGTKEYITVKLNNLIRKRKSGKVEVEDKLAVKPGDVIMVSERIF
jgi:protein involved in polysaccharide export with SLBB domain